MFFEFENKFSTMKNKNIKQDKILELFVNKLRESFPKALKKIILFGSHARGDFVKYSDYDLLVILDRVTPRVKNSINELEGEMLYNYGAVFSAFPFSLSDIERLKYEPFIMNAQREGIKL